MAYARLRLGVALRADGRPQEAVQALREARRGFREQNRLVDVARCEREAAVCLAMAGENDRARQLLARAPAVFDAAGDDAAVRGIDLHTVVLLWEAGLGEECVELGRRALDDALSAQDVRGAFVLTSRLVDALFDLGHIDEAAAVMATSPDPLAGTGVAERALNLASRSRLATASGDPVAGAALIDEGLALVEGTTQTTVQASLYAARAEMTQGSAPEASSADRARAVALFLAAGEVGRARATARSFLPPEAG